MSPRADFCCRGPWRWPPSTRTPHQTQKRSGSESRGSVCQAGGACGGGARLLPSTRMCLLNTSVCWSWETVHVQVPLSCNPTWGSDRLLASFFLLFPGPFHCTEGLLPEGPSKVMVRLCPSIKWVSELAVTVGGAGQLCHTQAPSPRRREEARRPRVSLRYPHPNISLLPIPSPRQHLPLPSPSPCLSQSSLLVSLCPPSVSCLSIPFTPTPRSLRLPLPDPRPEEGLRRRGGLSDQPLDC